MAPPRPHPRSTQIFLSTLRVKQLPPSCVDAARAAPPPPWEVVDLEDVLYMLGAPPVSGSARVGFG